jgi:choline dehydrogenase-like flavoprotein
MIRDADDLSSDDALQADICIVGAGPAGITIALKCAHAGLHVLLLESGGLRPDAESQSLCRGDVVGPGTHPPAHRFRRRGLGGSTSVWGGRCVPFDRLDFAARPWLGLDQPWPITYEDVLTYWGEAAAMLDIGAPSFEAATAVPGGMRPMLKNFKALCVTTEAVERFSAPVDFGRTYRRQLSRSRRILLVLHATCTSIDADESHTRIAGITLHNRSGLARIATARHFILAAGGLEISRLLLASRRQLPAGIGNTNGLVGRSYMCHLAGTTGVFMAEAGPPPWHGYDRDACGVYCRRRFSIHPAAQAAYRIGNAVARLHHPRLADPDHRSGPLSLLYLGRHALPPEYAVRLQQGGRPSLLQPGGGASHVWNVVRDAPATAGFVAHLLRRRLLVGRKYPSITVAPKSGRFTLDVHAEQLPNPESRLLLGDRCDRFGVPELRIDWRHSEADLRTARVTVALIADALKHGGHGELVYDPDTIDLDMLRDGAYGGHHLGGARMSDTARTGVVDRNSRVHGLGNLYVASGAVFPTSGQANPTFTIMCLALRLASHLVVCSRTDAAPTSLTAIP